MDRSTFRETLREILKEKLVSRLHKLSEERYQKHQQFVRYISAIERKYEGLQIINEGLPSVLSSLKKQLADKSRHSLTAEYISTIDEIAAAFPEKTTWQQRLERFEVQDEDSTWVVVGKRVKSVSRLMLQKGYKTKKLISRLINRDVQGLEPKKQKVPLQALVKAELMDETIARKWIRSLQKFELLLIRDIEDFLVQDCVEAIKTNSAFEVSSFVDRLSKQVDEQKEKLDRLIEYEVKRLEEKVLQQAEKAGTFEYPAKSFADQRLSARRDKVQNHLQEAEQKWIDTQQLMLDRTENVSTFLQVYEDLETRSEKFLNDFEQDFRIKLDAPMQELIDMLEEVEKSVGGDLSVEKVAGLQEKLSVQLEEHISAPLQNLAHQQVLSRKVDHFMENLLVVVNQVPERASLIYDLNLEDDLPSAKERPMEWRLLVVRALRDQVMNTIQPNKQQYEAFLSELMQDISEIRDIIAANLESAQAAFDEHSGQEVEDPQIVLQEGLQRLQNKVEGVREKITAKWQIVEKAVHEGLYRFCDSMLGMVHEGNVKELQLLNAKYKVKETTKDWQTAVDSKLSRGLDRISIWKRFTWKRGKEWWQIILIWLGLEEKKMEERKRADIASYLSETDQRMRELPYIYRRLFNFDEVADQRFYVSPLDATSTVKKAYEQWSQSSAPTLAVVGEKGSGKSTFLNQVLTNIFTDEQSVTIEMTHTVWNEEAMISRIAEELGYTGVKNTDELIANIREKGESRVVVIERVQNCFVRNINGYEAIEKLCYLITETKDHIFWIVSSSLYAWQLLGKIVQLNEYFSHVVETDTLNSEQIEKIIMSRHRASGYALHFEPNSAMETTRVYRKLRDRDEEAQEYLKERYFEMLTQLAEGNASIAMIFWIRSIREFDESHFYIRPLEVPSLDMIQNLNPQVLFALAAVILHDSISDRDLSMILNLTKEESRLLLNRLHSRGLLVKSEGVFGINHLMYRQIVQVLKERNILHLR